MFAEPEFQLLLSSAEFVKDDKMNDATQKYDLTEVARAVAIVLLETQCCDQCVPSSAILLNVLHRTGYPDAYPMSLRAEITNVNGSIGVKLGYKQVRSQRIGFD